MKNRRGFIRPVIALTALLLLATAPAEARKRPSRKARKLEATEKADSVSREKSAYDKLLDGAVTDQGVFNVHRKGTDIWFEIPDSLLGRDMLVVNKISGVPYALNDTGINKGMGFGEKLIRFHKDTLYKKVWVATYDPASRPGRGTASPAR